ncbi:MAG: NAD-dependent epimerase/dehydratase family protein [Candidatus Latescibacterota bacterium]
MSIAVITGSAGLVGSESARHFHDKGFDVVGIDNDMRRWFFGDEGSTGWRREELETGLRNYRHHDVDIRDAGAVDRLFARYGSAVAAVIHTAAQPSHEWARRDPVTDFTVNACGTLNLLEGTRKHAPDATFIFTSTNKVYGDTPNALPLVEKETRWEVHEAHPFHRFGIDESMSLDRSRHSLFGASKLAADILTQEYGHTYGLKTGTFRGGCLTGPGHAGVELHGWLAYLVRCALIGKPFTVYGYKGKQVRDNLHSSDLIAAFWHFHLQPRPGEVYNIGGGRHSHCSLLEAIAQVQEAVGVRLDYMVASQPRPGDHIWWISDVRRFHAHYPQWEYHYDTHRIIREIVEAQRSRGIGHAEESQGPP